MDNILEEEDPDWKRFCGYIPSPNDSHEFGECVEDWRVYEWRKEQEKMDSRRKKEEGESWITMMKEYWPRK